MLSSALVIACQIGLSMVEIREMKVMDYPSRDSIREQRRQAAIAAVKKCKGNVTEAAKALGLSRQMLYLLVPGGFHSK